MEVLQQRLFKKIGFLVDYLVLSSDMSHFPTRSSYPPGPIKILPVTHKDSQPMGQV